MPGKKILIVDDELDFVKLIRIRLESSGYKVIEASNGEAGLKSAMSENPDLILLDIMMPKKDGYSLLREIKSIDKIKHIPVIVITAKAEMQEPLKIEGASEYLVKPFEGSELLRKIKNIIK